MGDASVPIAGEQRHDGQARGQAGKAPRARITAAGRRHQTCSRLSRAAHVLRIGSTTDQHRGPRATAIERRLRTADEEQRDRVKTSDPDRTSRPMMAADRASDVDAAATRASRTPTALPAAARPICAIVEERRRIEDRLDASRTASRTRCDAVCGGHRRWLPIREDDPCPRSDAASQRDPIDGEHDESRSRRQHAQPTAVSGPSRGACPVSRPHRSGSESSGDGDAVHLDVLPCYSRHSKL